MPKFYPHRPLWSFPFPLIGVYNVSQPLPILMHTMLLYSGDVPLMKSLAGWPVPMHAGRERELGLGQTQRLSLASLYEASSPALGTDDSRPTLLARHLPARIDLRAPFFVMVMRAGVRSFICRLPVLWEPLPVSYYW